MTDYDFSTLNDKEFENLSIDLISKDKNKRFERFKAGKDGGIDGRFYHDNGTQEIIQCKHYLKTGFSGLITSLNKKNNGINEIDKVKKLNSTKYIFVTSLPLSAENKKAIKELFAPYIKNDSDIYGQEDLNQILGSYPDIEKRHYKLWLSSTVVLDRIINNAIESRSEFLLEDIKEKSKYYAITENHNKAIDKLEESHIIIIAGEPGIGKTTLAEHLALWYIEKDFKFYNIENSINEAESIYKRDEKQIFYYDDFLGTNYLNAIEDKKDSHIVKFMDRIKKDKTKRFILTSRTNIFNQGLALSDTFKSKNIENEEFIIKIESLKDIDKALILYNHIWHSSLDEEFIDQIYIDKRYKQIIKHKNFNPRLIAFITDIQKIQKEQIIAKDYWNYIVDKLDNPQDVWKNTFDTQSDDFTRILVMMTVFNGNKIEENKLRDSYNKYIELTRLTSNSHASKDFDSIIKEVVKYFLNRNTTYHKKIEYSLFNPSIADFVLNKYKNNSVKLKHMYLVLASAKSLKELRSLNFLNRIDKSTYEEIILFLYQKLDVETENIDYTIMLLYMEKFINIKRDDIDVLKRNTFIQNIINEPKDFTLIDEFISIVSFMDLDELEINSHDFILKIIENASLEEDVVNSIMKLIDIFYITDADIIKKINELVNEYVGQELDGYMSDIGISDVDFDEHIGGEIEDGEYYMETKEYYVKDGCIEDCIDNGFDEVIKNLNLDKKIVIDRDGVINSIDRDKITERLVESYINTNDYEPDHREVVHNVIDSIDELFQR
ncbi:MAG: restriction endonuclease [Sulfurimonas sp.]|nr:restriction endonuclease [Sulfurimonas sp.]